MLRGLALLARFRVAGLEQFGDRGQDFLNSLAPLAGLTLVVTLLHAASGDPRAALGEAGMTLIALLAPPVIAHALARRWGREAAWVRYATAFTWCHWLIVASFGLVLVGVTGLLAGMGAPPDVAVAVAELIWAAYGLSLHWFLARRGLGISRGRSAVLMAAVEFGSAILVIAPLLAAGRAMPGAVAT